MLTKAIVVLTTTVVVLSKTIVVQTKTIVGQDAGDAHAASLEPAPVR